MDLIEKQAAIDALQKEIDKGKAPFDDVIGSIRCGVRLARNIIEDLPTTQPEPQWIPCSERLPEANGRYLVTRGLNACGAMWNRVYLINYSDLMGLKSERIWWDGNVGKSDFERIDDVIAWMALPEPWRGEEHEVD